MSVNDRSGAAFETPTGNRGLVWRRFRRDKIALASLITLALIVFACFVLEPILVRILGHGPDEPFPYAVNIVDHHPVGWFSSVQDDNLAHPGKTFLLLGGDGPLVHGTSSCAFWPAGRYRSRSRSSPPRSRC